MPQKSRFYHWYYGKHRNNDRGSAVVEASIGIPLFLFVMLFFFHLLHVQAVRSCVYEAAVEAAEYTAELAFLETWAEEKLTGDESSGEDPTVPDGSLLGKGALFGAAEMQLLSSMDEPELVDRYVVGGRAGVLLLGSKFPDENGDYVLVVNYTIRIRTPLLPDITYNVEEEIHQKPYLGHTNSISSREGEAEDPYVYVTDNREVYHTSRACTHLMLDSYVEMRSDARSQGFRACEYCGKDAGEIVIVCPEGEAYHSSAGCRGLRRTVYRVRLSEAAGLPACSRCGGR